MVYKIYNDEQHIKNNLNMYTGDLSCTMVHLYNLNTKKIESLNISMASKKILEEIIENILDYLLTEDVERKFIVNSGETLEFINPIKMKMYDRAEINGVIQDNVCIPELIMNTKASSKFDESMTIGMNGLGLKVIIPLCDVYLIQIKIDDKVFNYNPFDEVKSSITSTNTTTNTNTTKGFNNYWSVKYKLKQHYFSTNESIINNSLLVKLKLFEVCIYSQLINKEISLQINNKIIEFDLNEFLLNILGPDYTCKSVDLEYINIKQKIKNVTIKSSLYINVGLQRNIITIVNGKYLYNYLPNGFKDSIKKILNLESDIFKYLSIILILNQNKFEFTGQNKENLCGTFRLTSSLPTSIKVELQKYLSSVVAKKVIPKGERYIPGSSKDGILILVEGLSALTSVRNAIAELKKSINIDTSIFTYYAVTGKIKNYVKSDVLDARNVYSELFTILNYSAKKSKFKEILIFSDADDDGIHIIYLILALFKSKFPLLFNIIKIPLLPRYICCNEYFIDDNALKNHSIKPGKHEIIYCKGLGTYSKQQLSHIIKNKNKYFFNLDIQDEELNEFMNIMGKESSYRKELYNSTNEELEIIESSSELNSINLNNFTNSIYKQYLLASTKRCLVNLEDSFNPSIRKIVHLLRTNYPNGQKLKINQLASRIIADLKYHHGDVNLSKTIIRVSTNYPTGLTIPIGQIEGNGGSRVKNGKDSSAPRYISVSYNQLMHKIIRKEDDIILEHLFEEGSKVEPKVFYPIVPLILINFSEYIGSGFNCRIPSFDVHDVCNYIKLYLSTLTSTSMSNSENNLKTYVRNFKGKTRLVLKNKKMFFESSGIYEYNSSTKVLTISEIPHFSSINQFIEVLEKKKFIVEHGINDTPDEPHLIIRDVSLEQLEIIKNVITQYKPIQLNLFLDDNLVKYDNILQILSTFCGIRYQKYVLRKTLLLKEYYLKLLNKIIKLNLYKNIINDFPKTEELQLIVINEVSNKINLKNYECYGITITYVIEECTKILSNTKVIQVTTKNISKLDDEIKNFINFIKDYYNKSPADIWLDEINDFLEEYSKNV